MTDQVFTGNAAPAAQVSTVQITGYDAASSYILTVNGIEIAVPGTTDVDGTAAALQAEWDASAHPYFSAITATVSTDTLTLTGPSMMPFVVTSSVVGGTGTIGSVTEATAATGPHHWNDADNWSTAVPVSTDDVYIVKPDVKILWGLAQSAVTLASLTVRNNPLIGLPSDRVTTAGDGSTTNQAATEYREHYLEIKATTTRIGEHLQPGEVNGTRRCKIDNSITTDSTTTVFNTGSSSLDPDRSAVLLKFASANADLFVRFAQAGVGVAADDAAETSTLGNVVVSDETTISSVYLGEGVTLTNWEQSGGDNVVQAAANFTLIKATGGRLLTEGLFTVTTIDVSGRAALKLNHTGDGAALVTTLNQDGGTLDFRGSGAAQTVTNYNFNLGTRKISDDLTITNDNRVGRITEVIEAN